MKIEKQSAAIAVAIVLLVSVMAAGIVISVGEAEDDIILVRIEETTDILAIREHNLDIIERYNNFALVRANEQAAKQLQRVGLNVNMLPRRTEISVKGHQFDINEGYPEFPEELMIDGYEAGEEGMYLVHMLGPVNAEWRATLESKGVDIITYAPNYAYEVRMTPELAERVEDLDFVDWVGIYQPGFKLARNLQPGAVSINMVDGSRYVTVIEDESQLIEMANDNEVYYVSQYHEPKLLDEMATQTIGGGLWVYMPDGDPDSVYRGHGQYGSLATQLGYDGSGIVTAVADTGLGDGTTPDAGHSDFAGRVLGGVAMDGGSWDDGHGHGTHCAGSAAGHTHGGTGDTVYEDYYSAEGLAPNTDLYAVAIFDSGGSWIGGDDYYEIVDIAARNAGAYVHSNSWGAETEGEYTESDHDFDRATRDVPMILSVAAGNAGPGARGGGYNSVGSPGNAKNAIVVGATENYPEGSPDNMAGFSSRGWTNDNRVKPDVVAPGQDIYSTDPDGGYQYMSGTSMACPAVSGAATSIVHWYQDTHGSDPSPSMVRTLMINTAYNLANDNGGENSPHIPNQDEGWGMVNLPPIVDPQVNFILEDQTSSLGTGDIDEYYVEYDDNSEPLKISVAWTDPAAAAGADPTLINDLNLEVISPDGSVYRGNNLVESWSEPGESTYSTFDTNDDGWDNVNNVENVFIRADDMEAGTYTVRIIGADVPDPNQDYTLVMNNALPEGDGPDPPPTYDLTINAEVGGTTDPAPGTYTYDENEDVQVEAIPDVGYEFTEWTGDVTSTNEVITVTMDDDKTVTANFEEVVTYDLTINAGVGGTTDPAPGTHTYSENEDVQVEAIPDIGYEFTEWSGDVTSTNEVITVTMDDDKTVTANFEEATYDLTINSEVGGTTDPAPGTYTYSAGEDVPVEANPDEGWIFAYWTGDYFAGENEDNPIIVTMDADKTITAHFEELVPPEPPAELTVEHVGEGDTQELITNGHFVDGDDQWEMTRDPMNIGNDEGQAGWVDDEQFEEGGSIWAMAEQEGDGNSIEEVIWTQDISPTSEEITVNGAYMKNLITEHDNCDITGIVYVHVYDTGVSDWVEIYEEVSEDDVSTGWIEFGPDATYTPEGEVDTVLVGMHINAVGNSRGPNLDTASGEIWMDAISVTTEGGIGDGTEDNLITWNASPDEPDVVEYNIYRSEGEDEAGPYDLIATVAADGSAEYEYVDSGRGTADDTLWWYIVHAVDEHDQECEGAGPVQEPGEELETFEISLTSGGGSDGWNFVSFNLELQNTDLEAILEHEDYGISDSYDKLMYYDASADEWYSHVPGRADQFNNIDTWDHTMGLWIRMTTDDVLTVEGLELETTEITLRPGWNMVGLPSSSAGNHDLPEEVSHIGYFDGAEEYNLAYDYDPQNFQFQVGEGYWVYNDANYDVDWTVSY